MNKLAKAALAIALAIMSTAFAGAALAGISGKSATTPVTAPAIPKLVDLGAGMCIPCRQMAPILEQLRNDFTGQFEVIFIDVWKTPEAGKPYRIRVIPTQIFYDANGKELFRHEGFFSREQILGKWRVLGFYFSAGTVKAP